MSESVNYAHLDRSARALPGVNCRAERKLRAMAPYSHFLRFGLLWQAGWRARLAHKLLGWLLLLGISAAHAQALPTPAVAEAIGMVKTLSGQAFIDLNGQRYAAELGMPVYLGTRLVTAPGSSLGVTFRDETVIAIGPDTQLVIDQYLFSPRQGKLGLMASLVRGTLNYVSGQIAKLRPDAVNVNTPTGMIGVRGTQFVARVDPS